jgi:uncharacterized membrane protein
MATPYIFAFLASGIVDIRVHGVGMWGTAMLLLMGQLGICADLLTR